jgi:hypothetical protein
VFDLFYKIKALYEQGIKIHLHCFEYGRGQQPELNKYCEEVFYYQREKLNLGIPLRLPYIVSSRMNPQLIKNLLKNNFPILLEGIHCTYYLYHGELNNRKVLVRLHNVEFEYYRQLAASENNFFKKLYYLMESRLLKKYEKLIAGKAKFLVVNEKDAETYRQVFGAKKINFLPVFLPFTKVISKKGKGNYCLYHGNLSVSENEKAAIWLLENVFDHSEIDFFIAGKSPSENLRARTDKINNAILFANPSPEKMEELIANAHIHMLPSINTTGIKIKLLHALFNGRFVITNDASLKGTGLESLAEIAADAAAYKQKIAKLFQEDFTETDINKRAGVLENKYNTLENARQLIQWIY